MQQFNRESGQPQIACVNCRVKHFENPIAKKKKPKLSTLMERQCFYTEIHFENPRRFFAFQFHQLKKHNRSFHLRVLFNYSLIK